MALIVIPSNSLATLIIAGIVAFIELLRIVVAYSICARKSAEVRLITKERIELKMQLATIKSAQLELVKKSLIERKIIEADKKMESFKEDVLPALQRKLKGAFFYVRLAVYGLLSILCHNMDLVVVDSNTFFPFIAWPFAHKLINLPAWGVIIISSLAARHVLRTVVAMVSSEVIV